MSSFVRGALIFDCRAYFFPRLVCLIDEEKCNVFRGSSSDLLRNGMKNQICEGVIQRERCSPPPPS